MSDRSETKYSEQIGELNSTMKHYGERLEDITQELRTMNATLIRNTEQLEVHIKRTQQNEDAIRATSESVDERLKPIEKHVIIVNTYGKILVAAAGIPAVLYYIVKLIMEISGR
jgi:predicted  nucleic acid-binding Zn-ribbon protein